MEHQLRMLWQIQLLEQKGKLLEKQKSQVNMQGVREMWEKIKTITQKIASDEEKLQQLKNICDKQEVELSDISIKYRQLEKLLYSDDIKSLKEIEQIKVQYDAAKMDVGKMEQDYFHKVDTSDELSREIIASEKILQEKKAEHAKKQQEISQEIAAIDAEIAAITNQYYDLFSRVDSLFIEKYKMLKQKMSFPIAEMKNGICGGCRMGLPESRAASHGKELTYCDHCGRILIKIND
jgi:predicted  nucleic acid-binding Zn-ribbon protein